MADANPIRFSDVSEQLAYCPNTGIFTWKVRRTGTAAAGSRAGGYKKGGYRQILVCGKRLLEHRLAFLFMTGEFPKFDVDHINGIRDDNRWANLRDVPTAVNMQNQQALRNKAGGLLGAHWHKRLRKWAASICLDGKIIHIGYFATAEEAHAAYVSKKRQIHVGGRL